MKISHIFLNLQYTKGMLSNVDSLAENVTQKKMLTAMQRVLKPLIRLALAQGINYQMLLETLKTVFVQVAEEDFKLEKRDQTDSRISLLTGIHRKDVRRLREEPENNTPLSLNATFGSQLVGLWISDNNFLDSDGKPKPLERFASDGGEVSFERLVARVSKDIRARPVLDEWLRVGVVYLDDNELVCLNTEAFVPKEGFEEKLFFFQQNIHDHIAATAHNLMNLTPPMLERCVYYDGLTPEGITELKALSENLGMHALKAVNAKAIDLQEKSKDAEDIDNRFTFAMYFYHVKERFGTKLQHEYYRRKTNRIEK
ncbi:MAG TPA: DUF6502 family protein [Methylotenera sp.]|nr:DUF6502 family protein [Methylotenera sp.]HPN02121.1 DUF6502 family protein [Methylotenera sp.]